MLSDRFKKEIEDTVDNKVVSWSLLKWLNSAEQNIRQELLNYLLIYIFGKENKLLWGVIYLIFRKEIKEILDDSKEITKNILLNFIEKIKSYKSTRV